MGKSAPSAPSPAQQSAVNADTAMTQQYMNMIDQATPYGNVSYTPTGESMTIGTGRNAREVPRYQQNVNLAPSQQRQLDLTNQLSESALGVGNTAFGNVAQGLQSPFDPQGLSPLGGDASADRQKTIDDLYNTQVGRLDDRYGRSQSALENKLANQGIQQGSEAYTAAMNDFNYGKNDAYNSAMGNALTLGNQTYSTVNQGNLQNRQQGFTEESYKRSLPVNELATLLGFSGGVQAPQYSAPPQTGVQGVNIPTQQPKDYSTMNSILGAGAQLGAAMLSDSRAKEDIKQVGKLDNGLPVYSFKYKGSDTQQIGLMAQDVEKVNPDAVKEINGLKHVDYGRAAQ